MAVLNGIWDFIEGQNKTATLFVVSGTFLRKRDWFVLMDEGFAY